MELCVQCLEREINYKFVKLCKNCYNKNWNKKNPYKYKIIYQKSNKKNDLKKKQERRKKRGLPGYYPSLKAPDGMGCIIRSGYKVITSKKYTAHPNARKNGTILEHVLVMNEMLGRPLIKGETVHHKNGIRHDNRPENLELWVSNHPSGQRPAEMIEWGKSFFPNYGYELVPKQQMEMRYE